MFTDMKPATMRPFFLPVLFIILSLSGCSGETIRTFLDHFSSPPADNTVYTWVESASNPLFGGNVSGNTRAYYCSVIKVGSVYHIWYGDGAKTRHTNSVFSDFHDCTNNYPPPVITVGGIPIDTYFAPRLYMYHPNVFYNSSGWTVSNILFTEPFLMYITMGLSDFQDVYVLCSTDGADWTEIGKCTGIAGAGGYGPQGSVVYNLNVIFDGGTNWKGYADNGGGQIQYYISSNGFDWIGQSANILGSSFQGWEGASNNIKPMVIKTSGVYYIYYSSGMDPLNNNNNNSAIGMAFSTDGKNFTKATNNPIFTTNDAIPWRTDRTYTPWIIRDGTIWRMYYTGRSTAGVYSIGMATKNGELY